MNQPPESSAEPRPDATHGTGHLDPSNYLVRSLHETDQVESQLVDFLNGWVQTFYVTMGVLANASRRLATEIPKYSAQDECIAFHLSRTFTNAEATFILLRKGLVIESTTMLRATLENTAQAVLFLQDAKAASQWLQGKKFTPVMVRSGLGKNPDFQPLYARLSDLAHANPEARWQHSVVVGERHFGTAYGGTYQPKGVAEILVLLVDLVLVFLRSFYDRYSTELALDVWPLLIASGQEANQEFRTWVATLPDDAQELAAVLSTQALPEPIGPPVGVEPEAYRQVMERLKQLPADRIMGPRPKLT
jgi:hypothetical protein